MQAEGPKEWTVGELVRWATDDFRARGLDSPRLEAELLVAFALGLSRVDVIVGGARVPAPAELVRLRELVRRRRSREPMAYLRGEREFYGLTFKVDRRVLVPRPDTETLVDVALARTEARSLDARVLDLCTGSGCVAIAIARQRPTSAIVATDASAEALEVARANALRLGAYRIAFALGDLYGALDHVRLPWSTGRFDAIVSNPPYVPTAECEALMPDVRDFEPRAALDGGPDGLAFYRRLVAGAPARLAPGGLLALEVGAGQAPDVAALFSEAGFREIEIKPDLAKIDRVVSGRSPSP